MDFTRRHPFTGLFLAAGAGFLLYEARHAGVIRRAVRMAGRFGLGLIAQNLAVHMDDWTGDAPAE